jgi:hypothetical protein
MALTYVADYYSDIDSDESCDEPQRKRRRVNRIWLLKETFQISEAAEKAVESRKIWKKSSSKVTSSGERVNYRCTAGKYRTNECLAGLYLLYHAISSEVSLFETDWVRDWSLRRDPASINCLNFVDPCTRHANSSSAGRCVTSGETDSARTKTEKRLSYSGEKSPSRAINV